MIWFPRSGEKLWEFHNSIYRLRISLPIHSTAFRVTQSFPGSSAGTSLPACFLLTCPLQAVKCQLSSLWCYLPLTHSLPILQNFYFSQLLLFHLLFLSPCWLILFKTCFVDILLGFGKGAKINLWGYPTTLNRGPVAC